MAKTTEIKSSKPWSLFMYVITLTCDFGAFYEDMVVSLAGWNLSAPENASYFSFAVLNLGCVSGGRRNLDMF